MHEKRISPAAERQGKARAPPLGVFQEAGRMGCRRRYCGGSFVLAAKDKQTVSDVTNTIFTACIGYLVTYAAKSATEKVSRNRHGLDADGNPIENNMEE